MRTRAVPGNSISIADTDEAEPPLEPVAATTTSANPLDPARNSRRHLYSRLALTSACRATSVTTAPGAKAAATNARF